MEYITLILASDMAVYFIIYIGCVFFIGAITNKRAEDYKWSVLQMVIIALVSYYFLNHC